VDLFKDVCIARFVDLECFVTVWANDVVHSGGPAQLVWDGVRAARRW
jgi:hypothetical protein